MEAENRHYTPDHAPEFPKRGQILHPFYIWFTSGLHLGRKGQSYNPLFEGEKSDVYYSAFLCSWVEVLKVIKVRKQFRVIVRLTLSINVITIMINIITKFKER
jgi:hypothetical protein